MASLSKIFLSCEQMEQDFLLTGGQSPVPFNSEEKMYLSGISDTGWPLANEEKTKAW